MEKARSTINFCGFQYAIVDFSCFSGINDFNQYWSAEKVVQNLANIQIFIDVKTRELEDFRKLPLNDITLNEIRILEVSYFASFYTCVVN